MKKQTPQTTISHCSVTNEAFKVDQHTADAIRSVADAAAANARAIERLADRIAGPTDNRVGISLRTSE